VKIKKERTQEESQKKRREYYEFVQEVRVEVRRKRNLQRGDKMGNETGQSVLGFIKKVVR